MEGSAQPDINYGLRYDIELTDTIAPIAFVTADGSIFQKQIC